MNSITVNNTADWHAHQAIKAYRRKDYDTYTRHIKQADELRCFDAWASDRLRSAS